MHLEPAEPCSGRSRDGSPFLARLYHLLLLLAFLGLLGPPIWAQPSTIWNRTYGGTGDDSAVSVLQAWGDYLVVGNTKSFGVSGEAVYVLRIDAQGDMIWNKTFDMYGTQRAISALESGDGGFIILAIHLRIDDSYNWIFKIDGDGNNVWEKKLGGDPRPDFYDLAHSRDGGFLAVGNMMTENQSIDAYAVKFDEQGTKIWERTYGTEGFDRAMGLTETQNGGFLLVGYTGPMPAYQDSYLIRIDPDGNLLWERNYSRKGMSDWAYWAIESENTGFIVGGLTMDIETGEQRVLVMGINKEGDKTWERIFGDAYWQWPGGAVRTHQGYIIAGATQSPDTGLAKVLLLKIDNEGNLTWNTTISGPNSLIAYSIVESWERGFIAAGSSTPMNGRSDIFIMAGYEGEYPVPEPDSVLWLFILAPLLSLKAETCAKTISFSPHWRRVRSLYKRKHAITT